MVAEDGDHVLQFRRRLGSGEGLSTQKLFPSTKSSTSKRNALN